MSLKDQVTEDMKNAMRAKDSVRLGTIRLLLAAVKQKEVDERVVVDDVMLVGIVDKLIKQRKDSVAAYVKAQRQDLADKEREVKLLRKKFELLSNEKLKLKEEIKNLRSQNVEMLKAEQYPVKFNNLKSYLNQLDKKRAKKESN